MASSFATLSRSSARASSPEGKAARATGPTESLARFAVSLRPRALPRHVVERAKDLVLDHLGVALYGACLPWSTIVRQRVLGEGGHSQSSIYGSRRVTARSAALVNGTAAHAIELDDTHDESLSHPGAVVLPAALALAEHLDRSGMAVLTAMVAAYEVQGRIGISLSNSLLDRGFHPPAVCGVFGATTAAGCLAGLDVAGMVSAFGSAVSMASGVMQFSDDPAGTMIKRLHAGLAAERGVLAAQLAADGFLGPGGAIEGRYGFAGVFAQESDVARIAEGSKDRFEIERITVKLYACCKLFHSMIEAIGECRKEQPFAAEDVVAIEPFGPRFMIDTHMEYRPQSTMAAQYSLPYACAAAILLDPGNPDSFSQRSFGRRDVLRLADSVKPTVDPELEAIFPRKFGGGVRILLRDGRRLTSTVTASRSSPERPLSREDVQDKFRRLTNDVLSPKRQAAIIDAVAELDRAESIRSLTSLLRGIALPVRGGA